MSLSRGGFELNEIWAAQQRQLTEADSRLRGLERRVTSGAADDEEIERLHRDQTSQFGEPSPDVTTALYQSHARRRDIAHKKYRESNFKDESWGSEWVKHRDSTSEIVWNARKHHGTTAGQLLAPHGRGHDVHQHVADLLSASGGKRYDARGEGEQEDKHHVGHIAATTWADTSKGVGEAFDKAFKTHYKHKQSTSQPMAVRQDSRNTDNNGRRYTVHPDDVN